MWVYTFVNQYSAPFEYYTGEGNCSDLEYIKYCLDRESILVDMQPKVD